MPLFRRKSSRQVTSEPYPDYDDTRWRYHLRTNAIETDHYCNEYVGSINADRKEAARLFKNNDESRARVHAESSLRNKRVVTALAALSPLSNALFQRGEPLAGYTSLAQIPEPARSGIVTIVFAAGHLNLKYLSETVTFLRAQFTPAHIDQLQQGEGELSELINPAVREALANGPPISSDLDTEIASAVKEYFGVSASPTHAPASRPLETANAPSQYVERQLHRKEDEVPRNARDTPLSTRSSEFGGPLSPYLGEEGLAHTPNEQNMKTPSPPPARSSRASKMYNASTVPSRFAATGVSSHGQDMAATVDVGDIQRDPTANLSQTAFASSANERSVSDVDLDPGYPLLLRDPSQDEDQEDPEYLRAFKDSDEMLLTRYDQLRSVISV